MTGEQIFDLVILIGETLLINGGEIFRTKQTMEIVAKQYGIQDFSSYIVANGFFTSATINQKNRTSRIVSISLAPTNLSRVEAINTLSRNIADGLISPEQALEKVKKIKNMHAISKMKMIIYSGLGSASFCFLFGGSVIDSGCSFVSGMLLYLYLIYIVPKTDFPHIINNIISSAIVTLFSCVATSFISGTNLDNVVIGSIFPLIPGVTFTNAIRHFLDNDYLSGVIRLVNALITVMCIALGVGIILKIWMSLELKQFL